MHQLLRIDVLFWIFFILLTAFFVYVLLRQKKNERKLRSDIKIQEEILGDDVEYDLILRAMRLCTWHFDVVNGEIGIDRDFRETGYHGAAFTGMNYKDYLSFIYIDDYENIIVSIENLIAGKMQSYQADYRIKTQGDDKLMWMESYGVVSEYDANGKPTKIVGVSRNIDERKKIEQALMDSIHASEETNRARSRFLANMSHEIRTPLNSISGYSQLIQDFELSEKERNDSLQRIVESCNILTEKFSSFADVVNSETGAEEIRLVPVDVNMLIKNWAFKVSNKIPNSQIEVSTHIPDEQLIIVSDMQILNTIMKHFLGNAIKFTRKGLITIGYMFPSKNTVRIWVKDTGIGMDKEQQKQCFEPFVKFNDFSEGVGLGLAVCKNLALSLDGRVGVESSPGVGSTFWLELKTEQ